MEFSTESPTLADAWRLIFKRAESFLRVPKQTTSDEWARKNRVYSKSTGKPGPRDPSLTPYKIPVSRAIDSGLWKLIVDVSGAQMGKTDTVLDVMGRRIAQSPLPILYVGPTSAFVRDQFEPRLRELIDQAPVLREMLAPGRMPKTRKIINGVPIRLAHGGSSSALKSDPAGLAFMDEYDEMLRNVKGQGDPLGLVVARGYTYADFVVAVNSTPSVGAVDTETINGFEFWKPAPVEDVTSPIWKLWQSGTRHHWAWACPHCGEFFIPKFKHLRWPEKSTPAEAKRAAFLLCPQENCGGIIEERHKSAMNERGVYVAPGQTVDRDGNVLGELTETSTISFWASGLASPFVTFGERAEAFLQAVRSGDVEKIQTAINAGFGELWAPGGGDVPELQEVYRLKQPYKKGDVPEGVHVITCAVDVQKNQLYFVVRGWGARATSWLLDQGSIWGKTDEPETWSKLDDLIEERYNGKPIKITFIDSGFRPNKVERGNEHAVYEYCRRHQRNTRPTKGFDSLPTPVKVSHYEVTPKGKAAAYGLELVRINTDFVKLWVHERIRWPQDQPGAFHLPEDVDDEYCAALISEARVRKPSGKHTWVRRSANNHYFDCEAMNYAASYLLNVQRIPEGYKAPREAAAPTTPQPNPPPAAALAPSRESWLGGSNKWFDR